MRIRRRACRDEKLWPVDMLLMDPYTEDHFRLEMSIAASWPRRDTNMAKVYGYRHTN